MMQQAAFADICLSGYQFQCKRLNAVRDQYPPCCVEQVVLYDFGFVGAFWFSGHVPLNTVRTVCFQEKIVASIGWTPLISVTLETKHATRGDPGGALRIIGRVMP
ncbi:hypothetical protein [Komagataeibacter europaeus]|uniref:hypothetical protein n=1 Tax=Komagataeibacter europaeus TaxID=33995 RepID=UPI00037DD76E|nr:hypothetical protein [Komagataeibacter europaeus]